MIFTTTDIFANNGNGWSDPVHFTFQGYDTSLFWDTDAQGIERVYVQGAHAWQVYPAIQLFEIDLATGESLSGDPVTMWTGTGGLVRAFSFIDHARAMNVIFQGSRRTARL